MRQRLASLCVLLCCAANVGFAAVANEAEPNNAQNPPISYADASDKQLTALAARWDELAAAERRALLSEVKMRMARRQAGTKGVLSIRLTRRYGAVPQGHSAGQLSIRVGTGAPTAKEFGVGFEQRKSQPQPTDAEPSEPAASRPAAREPSAPRPMPPRPATKAGAQQVSDPG